MRKKWSTPELRDLSVDLTRSTEYVDFCEWNGAEILGLGNEEYRDPNNKPSKHPNWVWCQYHGQWHPKVHGGNDTTVSGS